MKRILVVYHTQEKGNTGRMAELVAEGCRQIPNVEVELVDVNKKRVDMAKAEAADGYALGSPDYFSYVAGGLKQFFDDLLIAARAGRKVNKKPCVAFLTHGGGGKAIESIEKLAKACELELVAPSLSCKGAPAGEDAKKSVALGKALAERVAQGAQ